MARNRSSGGGRGKRPQPKSSKKSSSHGGGGGKRRGASSSSSGGGGGRRNRHEQESGGGRSGGRGRSRSAGRESGGGSRGFTSPQKLRGKVQKNRKGFAFIIPEERGVPDAFVALEDAQALLAGDTVEFSVRRAGHKPQAVIHKVLERGKTTVVGEIVEQQGDYFVRTLSHDYLYVMETERVETGQWVLGEMVHYPTLDMPGTVRIKQNFGKDLKPAHDLEMARAEFGLHEAFSQGALDEAVTLRLRAREEIEDTVGRPDEKGERRDLTMLDFVTIDGPDAKDFDDAVYVATPTGGDVAYILYVAIADVAFFVRPGSALEQDAKSRGTSVYMPGTVIPMLPESLSNDLCSLRPREKKLSLCAEIHFDRDANIVHSLFYDGVIETRERLTYQQANEYAEGKDNKFEKYLKPMRSLFKKMLLQRERRGTLDFVLPENKVEVDKEGNPIKIGPYPSFETNKWIEEFMVAANRVVAKALREAREPALYRVHEAPDPKALDELNGMFKAMGFNFRLKDLTPPDFHELLKKLNDVPKAAPLNFLILRSQKQASYQPEPLGHFGLALEDYCHFTSPIRRYPDLVVHRGMKALLRRERGSKDGSGGNRNDDLYALGQHCSARERNAAQAERWVVARKQCWFFKPKLGKVVPGRITGMNARGLYMDLDGTGAEGMLEFDRLPGTVTFDEAKYRVYLGSKKMLTLGDTFDVVISAIRWEDNRILIDPADKL